MSSSYLVVHAHHSLHIHAQDPVALPLRVDFHSSVWDSQAQTLPEVNLQAVHVLLLGVLNLGVVVRNDNVMGSELDIESALTIGCRACMQAW